MRILFIAPGYLPYTFSENLCSGKLVYALQEHGWEIDVISRKDEGITYCSEWKEPWLLLQKYTFEVSYPFGNKLEKFFDVISSSVQMKTFPVAGIRWARRAYEKAVELYGKKPYDAVLTRSPNDISHIVGLKLKQKFGVRWIANWNDPASTIWPQPYTHHYPYYKWKIEQSYTLRCLKNADVNTFPSQSLLDHFMVHFPLLKNQRTTVIPHIGLSNSLYRSQKAVKKDKFSLCHSGNLSVERNPELVFKALREIINEGNTSIQFDIMGNVNEFVEKKIEKYSLQKYVRFVGSFPYMEALHKMEKYDALVLLEANLDKGIFFASKFTDYAQINRPILAISPSSGFANSIINERGGGVVVDNCDCKSIKDGILTLYKGWEAGSLGQDYDTEKLYSVFSVEYITNLYEQLLCNSQR